MTIFAILMPSPQPGVVEQIQGRFPDDHLKINETQWLVSGTGTALDIVAKLGIYDPKNSATRSGNAIVFATTSYHGRAPTPTWEWIKSKLEQVANG